MTLSDLAIKLSEAGVPERLYSLGNGPVEDKYCLVNRGGRWEAFYVERGEELEKKTHGSESEACEAFLDWMIESIKLNPPQTYHEYQLKKQRGEIED